MRTKGQNRLLQALSRIPAAEIEARALLVDYWMGHENREMGTPYAKQLVEDVAWRKQWAKKVGLG